MHTEDAVKAKTDWREVSNLEATGAHGRRDKGTGGLDAPVADALDECAQEEESWCLSEGVQLQRRRPGGVLWWSSEARANESTTSQALWSRPSFAAGGVVIGPVAEPPGQTATKTVLYQKHADT
jgi:hypothetical protein